MDITAKLAKEFSVKPWQVENTVKLIDDGNTIPFIARYRKELTGELSDTVLRELDERLKYLRNLEERKDEVIRLIEGQGKLTEELKTSIEKAEVLQEVEDLYRPYKQKRRTRAAIAREKGLEPLADIILKQERISEALEEIAETFINPELGVLTAQDAIDGASDIVAEIISDNAQFRKEIRELTFRDGAIVTKGTKEEQSEYQMYYDFKEPVKKVAPHRILAGK
jgi:uncharacterized protein